MSLRGQYCETCNQSKLIAKSLKIHKRNKEITLTCLKTVSDNPKFIDFVLVEGANFYFIKSFISDVDGLS